MPVTHNISSLAAYIASKGEVEVEENKNEKGMRAIPQNAGTPQTPCAQQETDDKPNK